MPEEAYEPIIKKYLPKIKEMRLMDDDFMSAAFSDNTEGTQYVLQTILERTDLEVKSVSAQRELKNLYGRSVRLDIYATDSAGVQYDIEIQRADSGAGERRARYHQSIIDTNHLAAGQNSEALPEVYVIFFTEHDVRKQGLPIYHIDRFIAETNERFDDGAHIIYVNGAYEGEDTALGALIADFREKDPNKVRNKTLAERMRYLKESKEGVSHMCRIMEDLVQETRHEEFLSFIKNMWEQDCTVSQMAAFSKHSETDVMNALKELALPISKK